MLEGSGCIKAVLISSAYQGTEKSLQRSHTEKLFLGIHTIYITEKQIPHFGNILSARFNGQP